MAAFSFLKYQLSSKSPSDVSPQLLLLIATMKSYPVPPKQRPPHLSNSNAVIELSGASLRASSACGEDTSSPVVLVCEPKLNSL